MALNDITEKTQIPGTNGEIIKGHVVGPAATMLDLAHSADEIGGVFTSGIDFSSLPDESLTGVILHAPWDEDHSPKNDRDITEANEKLKHMSELSGIKPGYRGKLGDKDVTKKRNGMVLHRRTSSDYRKLWNYFLDNEVVDYTTAMGYTKEDIILIGYKKFIDANDWVTIKDVSKWRTDTVHVIPCVHCRTEFTTYELDLGLCSTCKKEYDLKKFSGICAANETLEPGISYGIRAAFVYQSDFRENFLINKTADTKEFGDE